MLENVKTTFLISCVYSDLKILKLYVRILVLAFELNVHKIRYKHKIF